MARLVLHIGTHKTATTTVQDTLAANRALLARQGIVYPRIGRAAGHHTLATHWIELPEVYYEPRPALELWREMAERHAGTDATVILSSEELSRWLPQAVDFAELRALVDGFAEKTVVCTLRNQLAYLQSIYLQITRESPGPRLETFLNQALKNRHATGVFLDYGALHAHLLKGFAAEEIVFLSYEAARRHPDGILGALFARLGMPPVELVPLPGDSNVSPEPLAAWAASQVALPQAASPRLRARAREALVETFGAARTTLYTRPEAARVAAHFAPLNAAFEARYRRTDPDFALAPLALSPDLVYRGQLTPAFWSRLGQPAPPGRSAPNVPGDPRMPKTELKADVLVRTDPALERRAAALFARVGVPGELPRWPSEELQKKYTGNHGPVLMRNTLRFVETLERAGALRPGWRGLDYGCGWGRIASAMLTRGGPEQLDLCDAWPSTIGLLGEAGFRNRVFAVSEVLKEGEVEPGAYDFVYAFSVFTHLRRDAFENNLRVLLGALKPGGKLYATVRHADYLPRVKAGPAESATLAREGFWYRPTGNSATFGIAVTERSYLERLAPGSLDYLGEVDPCQHLYALSA
jgi:SAM-dependent methyltransferase